MSIGLAEVDPAMHLIGTGWGGNPETAAVYRSVVPAANGFWPIRVYNRDRYFEADPFDAYSVNSLTALRDADATVTVQFEGTPGEAANFLPIMPGWNYMIRLYRPRPEIIDGSWLLPEARPD